MGLFHRKKKKSHPMFLYTEEELNQYEQYIMEQFGEYEHVFHEVVSSDIHLDMIIIPPTEKSNYYELITMGMGAYPMNVPEELKNENFNLGRLCMSLLLHW